MPDKYLRPPSSVFLALAYMDFMAVTTNIATTSEITTRVVSIVNQIWHRLNNAMHAGESDTQDPLIRVHALACMIQSKLFPHVWFQSPKKSAKEEI